jgi:hypothetical protein
MISLTEGEGNHLPEALSQDHDLGWIDTNDFATSFADLLHFSG